MTKVCRLAVTFSSGRAGNIRRFLHSDHDVVTIDRVPSGEGNGRIAKHRGAFELLAILQQLSALATPR